MCNQLNVQVNVHVLSIASLVSAGSSNSHHWWISILIYQIFPGQPTNFCFHDSRLYTDHFHFKLERYNCCSEKYASSAYHHEAVEVVITLPATT